MEERWKEEMERQKGWGNEKRELRGPIKMDDIWEIENEIIPCQFSLSALLLFVIGVMFLLYT